MLSAIIGRIQSPSTSLSTSVTAQVTAYMPCLYADRQRGTDPAGEASAYDDDDGGGDFDDGFDGGEDDGFDDAAVRPSFC